MMSVEQPFIDITLDYASLRREGMRQLERLAGSKWTDFNPHDPGITILEQYCYVLTELIYRCDFPLPDLLSRDGKNPYASLFSPARIMTSRPVTLIDLRKLAIDMPGVRNAWIEKVADSTPQVYYNRYGDATLAYDQEKLIQLQDNGGATPIKFKGLYRVLIEEFDSPPTKDNNGQRTVDIVKSVANRLQAHRPLCMDFESFEVMDKQYIKVMAHIEVVPGVNPENVYQIILGRIAAHIAPSIRFYSLSQRLAAGKRIDEIFDGPMLEQGFIDTAELSSMEHKTGLRVSDLIREIMDVEGVLMVKYLSLALKDSDKWENWWLELDETKSSRFHIMDSEIRLERQQIEINLSYGLLGERFQNAQAGLTYRQARLEDLDIIPPVGRNRHVGRYYSAQHHFPEVYGLGERGLPPQADGERRAQLKQLQAYLLFFDQLLANQFAQLAHIGDLLGFDGDNAQTYFAADIDTPILKLDGLWNDSQGRQKRLDQAVKNPVTPEDENETQKVNWLRKNRFLDHLLARFAEQFVDYAQFRPVAQSEPNAEKRNENSARDKQAWLSGYPELSAGRGTGFNILSPWTGEPDPYKCNCSGLERRLRFKLGLNPGVFATGEGRFYLIEHVLLRPADTDSGLKDLPLLADACSADPYSLQISLVFPRASQLFSDEGFRRFVESAIREETPVHLVVYVFWLEADAIQSFGEAYNIWSESQRVLRENNEQGALSYASSSAIHPSVTYKLRDARDRMIDLLEIGQTYPLADLPIEYANIVAPAEVSAITIISSQKGVLYQLFDKGGKQLLDKDGTTSLTIEAQGNGGNLVLQTPEIIQDVGFRIKASKQHSRLFACVLESDGKVHVEHSRLDTYYELCQKDGTAFNPKIGDSGNGVTLVLAPPHDALDKDFKVKTVKTLSVILLQAIDIRVGLDTSLQAEIVDAELLDENLPNSYTNPSLAIPRIVNFNATPKVRILNTQPGVDYRLVCIVTGQQKADLEIKDPKNQATIALKYISYNVVRGGSEELYIDLQSMTEDIDIRILAIRDFNEDGNQATQHALLDIALPLKVRANPGMEVTVDQSQLDYLSGTTVAVKAPQTSASYQLFARPILDSEFVRDDKNLSAFSIPGMASLRVADPPIPAPDKWPDAMPIGEAKNGDGAVLLPIDNLQEDSLIVVSAAKKHLARDGKTLVPSSIQLNQAAAILVRPGPHLAFPLRLKPKDDATPVGDGLKKGMVYQVSNGQPGVFYYFRQADTQSAVGLPVYFHKDGKGIGQLQVEVDFTLTGSLPTPPPEWECPVDQAIDAKLSIRAVKAQTGLEVVFEQTVAALLDIS